MPTPSRKPNNPSLKDELRAMQRKRTKYLTRIMRESNIGSIYDQHPLQSVQSLAAKTKLPVGVIPELVRLHLVQKARLRSALLGGTHYRVVATKLGITPKLARHLLSLEHARLTSLNWVAQHRSNEKRKAKKKPKRRK